jgi:hypothetical protein
VKRRNCDLCCRRALSSGGNTASVLEFPGACWFDVP